MIRFSILAQAEYQGIRAALRSGRRVPGEPPRFPSASLIFCVEATGGYEDLGWIAEAFDADVAAAALSGAEGRWLIAYLVRDPASGGYVCRAAAVPSATAPTADSNWRQLPNYPQSPGMAGIMTGAHGSVLLAAGGANFPGSPPWEGGVKQYYAEIYALLPGESHWRPAGRLPSPRAYGAAVSTPRGLLIAGGEDAHALMSDTLLLSWNGSEVTIESGPPLPEPAASAAAALLDGQLYLAGGHAPGPPRFSRHSFWRLDCQNPSATWETLAAWPGPGRALAVGAGLDGAFYLVSGLDVQPAGPESPAPPAYLRDAYRFRPETGWERLPDLPWSAVAAPSPAPVASDPARVFILGGVDGTQVGRLPRETTLPNDIVCFEAASNAWTLWNEPWPTPVVTVSAVPLAGDWVFVSGEIKAGKRTTEVWGWRPGPPPC